jgi:hypothetical protein
MSERPGQDEFDRIAAEVAAETAVPVSAEVVPGPEEPERFIVSDEFAREFVKMPFAALAKFVHPAFAISDEEAEHGARMHRGLVLQIMPAPRPPMQVCLQELADKYAPAMLAKMADNHRPLLTLIVAMSALGYAKWQTVAAIAAAEKAARAATEPLAPPPLKVVSINGEPAKPEEGGEEPVPPFVKLNPSDSPEPGA